MNRVKSIVLIGVGGQGTILVSKILTAGLISAGFDVKMSEIHGMAQRGGSVSTQVRYGDKVFSPVIGEGEADILVAFERMEAVRGSRFLKPDGVVIVNTYEIMPLPVAAGLAEYPDHLLPALKDRFRTFAFDAGEIANQIGNPRTMNLVLFGAMTEAFKMPGIDWENMIRKTVPAAYIDLNLRAFEAGRRCVSESKGT